MKTRLSGLSATTFRKIVYAAGWLFLGFLVFQGIDNTLDQAVGDRKTQSRVFCVFSLPSPKQYFSNNFYSVPERSMQGDSVYMLLADCTLIGR